MALVLSLLLNAFFVAGEFAEISARVTTRITMWKHAVTGEDFPVDAPDSTRTIPLGASGTPVSLAVRGDIALVPLGVFPAVAVVDLAQGVVLRTIPLPEATEWRALRRVPVGGDGHPSELARPGVPAHTRPNRDAVIQCLSLLRQLLFPGYFGKQGLTEQGITYRVGELVGRWPVAGNPRDRTRSGVLAAINEVLAKVNLRQDENGMNRSVADDAEDVHAPVLLSGLIALRLLRLIALDVCEVIFEGLREYVATLAVDVEGDDPDDNGDEDTD